VNFDSSPRQPSVTTRITAVAAALLVLALTILSASPGLHAWVHAHATPMTAGDHADHGPANPQPGTDEGCVVVLFAQGILAALAAYCVAEIFRRKTELMVVGATAVPRAMPRYWLPPLCGPPLS
jgi:hypothetical protein